MIREAREEKRLADEAKKLAAELDQPEEPVVEAAPLSIFEINMAA